jgi:iron complex transport system ATP-binding protein
MITVKKISLNKNKKPVLNDISFTLNSGEILGITGPAGCGKSLLLKAIAGIIRTADVTVGLNEKNLSESSRKEQCRDISSLLLPCEYNPEATVFEETIKGRIHLKKFLNPYSEIDRDATLSILDETGLTDKLSLRLKKCSDSIIRLTLIARTVNSESENIIIDSPECGLDPLQKLTVIRTIKKYTAAGDKSVLLASSDLDFLVKICDKIIVLKDGVVHESGGSEIITEDLMKDVFGIDVMIAKNIITGFPEIHIINNE